MGVAFITGMQGDDPALLEDGRDRQALRRAQRPRGRAPRVRRARQRARSRRHVPAAVRGGRAQRARRLGDGGLQPRSTARRASPARRCWRRRCAAGGASSATWSATAAPSTTSGSTTSSWRAPAEAAAAALRAGTDLDCGRAYRHLDEALARGLITEEDLDRALVRLFTARFRLGLFDPPDAGALVGARAGADRVARPT